MRYRPSADWDDLHLMSKHLNEGTCYYLVVDSKKLPVVG